MNYGAIGWIVGKEIIHGFDNEGRYFDKNGHVTDWWQPTTQVKYLEKAQCIIDQYDKYTNSKVSSFNVDDLLRIILQGKNRFLDFNFLLLNLRSLRKAEIKTFLTILKSYLN